MSIVLATGLEFELRGKKYRIQKMLGPNSVEAGNLTHSHDVLTLTSSDFTILIDRGDLRFLTDYSKPISVADFSQLPDADRETAVKKWKYISDLSEYTRKKGRTKKLSKNL